jgi:hypothetical protein
LPCVAAYKYCYGEPCEKVAQITAVNIACCMASDNEENDCASADESSTQNGFASNADSEGSFYRDDYDAVLLSEDTIDSW